MQISRFFSNNRVLNLATRSLHGPPPKTGFLDLWWFWCFFQSHFGWYNDWYGGVLQLDVSFNDDCNWRSSSGVSVIAAPKRPNILLLRKIHISYLTQDGPVDQFTVPKMTAHNPQPTNPLTASAHAFLIDDWCWLTSAVTPSFMPCRAVAHAVGSGRGSFFKLMHLLQKFQDIGWDMILHICSTTWYHIYHLAWSHLP